MLDAIEQEIWIRELSLGGHGCLNCPAHKVPGVVKILGEVTGKKILIWAQSPGTAENRVGQELVGQAGQLLWDHLARVGITREHCDIQNVMRCLDGKSKIRMADGSFLRLSHIVKYHVSDSVLSVGSDGTLVSRKIVGWYSSSRNNRRMVKLSYEKARSSRTGFTGVNLTADHRILTSDGFVPVDSLPAKAKVATGEPGLSREYHEFIVGSLLGDGGISNHTKRPCLFVGNTNREYVEYQSTFLSAIRRRFGISKDAIAIVPPNPEQNRPGITYRFQTAHLAVLAEIKDLWIHNNRKCVPETIKLSPRAIAVWWMDDGHLSIRDNRQPRGEFATCWFTLAEVHNLIRELRRFGIRGHVQPSDITKHYPRIHINVDSMPKLMRIIAPYVVPSMRHKIYGKVPSFNPRLWEPPRNPTFFDTPILSKATCTSKAGNLPETVYCIDVEETHNFVTTGGVVHNCLPAEYNRHDGSLYMRDPTEDELDCCSVFNRIAISQSKASIWLVFGRVAARKLFGDKKLHKVFYHHAANAKVFILDHPSFFLRGGSNERLQEFDRLLGIAAGEFKSNKGRFSILYKQRYLAITTATDALRYEQVLLDTYAKTKERIVYDFETDVINDKKALLCVGACIVPGTSYCFILDHPENKASEKDKKVIREVLIRLLKHNHEKAMHHGTSDCEDALELLGVKVIGFNFDTQYGDFMSNSANRGYQLSEIVARRYPEFSGYKDVVKSAVPVGLTVEEGRDIGDFHLSRVSLDTLRVYNGADCHTTKMVERDTKPVVPTALVSVYTDAAFILDEMESYGPLFDRQHYTRIAQVYPRKKEYHRNQVCVLAGNPDLSMNSPKQIKEVLYNRWRMRPINRRMDTKKETLEILQYKYPKQAGLKHLMAYRDTKTKVERIEAFERSATAHNERVSTFWWLTGARTGRLSSGGGARPDKRNYGNLQNVPSDDIIKNMLVSDSRWREFYEYAIRRKSYRTVKEGKIYSYPNLDKALKEFHDLDVFIASDYSQMELRILAQVTGDPEMVRIFNSGEDIHAAIGALWTGWPYEVIVNDDRKRRIVKALHFGIIYGLTPEGLREDIAAQGINISSEEAQGYYDSYFARMRIIRQFIDNQPKFAMAHGYVENLFGFRVPITIPRYGEEQVRGTGKASWQNQSVNSPIQGAAHHVLLIAIALLKRHRDKYKLIRPQMEIHDSLITVSSISKLQETIATLKYLQEKDAPSAAENEFNFKWKIPLVAEAKIGLRYGGLVKIKTTIRDAFANMLTQVAEQETKLKQMEVEYAA